MKSPFALLLLALALRPAAATTATTAPAAAPTIGLEEVQRGQKGYGLSVFTGTEPTRFEVEVLGVLWDLSPDRSYILARLSGPGVDLGGVSAGMSGSPVYLDGRLAGAVAFSWPFAQQAIAGITPIASMRRIPPAATPGTVLAAGGPPAVTLREVAALAYPADLLEKSLARLAPAPVRGTTSSVMWTASGFGPLAQSLLGRALPGGLGLLGRPAATAAGGATPAASSADPRPGGVIGAVLVDGDLRLAGVGTVTDIVGDRLFAFGHQFFGVGSVSIPMALGDVITVMPSLDSSFKLANLGRTIGSFDQDRVTGIAGRIGGQAPTTALEVHLEGEAERTLSMGLANLRNYLPSLVGTAALGSLETVIKGSGHQTVDVEARFDLKGQAPLAVRQSFDGENSALDVATYLLSIADLLVNNSFETLNLERVEVRLRTREGEQLASLDKAWADRSRARAGERLKLWAEFRSVRGASFRKSLEITLPADLPPGRYQLSLGDGPSQDAARLAAEPVEPRNVSELLAAARKLSSRTELVVLGSRSSRGLAFGGQPLPQLPGSLRSLLGSSPAGSESGSPLRTALLQREVLDVGVPIRGQARVEIEILDGAGEPVSMEPAPRPRVAGTGG